MPQNVCLASCCAHSISSCKSLLPWWWVKTFLASLSGVEWSSLPAILFLVVSAERKYTSWNRLRGVLEFRGAEICTPGRSRSESLVLGTSWDQMLANEIAVKAWICWTLWVYCKHEHPLTCPGLNASRGTKETSSWRD